MNKKVRYSMFETNSSSSHSISLKRREFVFEPLFPDKNGTIVVKQDQYYCDEFKFNSSSEKLSYLFAHLYEENKNKIKLINDVIYNVTHCDYFDYKEALVENTVDHQSVGIINDLFDNDYGVSFTNIKNFIFNKNYWVFGGSDGSIPNNDFYAVKEYTKQEVLELTFNYDFIFKINDEEHIEKLYVLTNNFLYLNLDDSELDKTSIAKICKELMYEYIDLLKNNLFYNHVLDFEPLNLNTDSETLVEGTCIIMLSRNNKKFITAAFKEFANDLHGDILKESYKRSFIGNKLTELCDKNYTTKQELNKFYNEFAKMPENITKIEFKIKKI